MNVCMFSPNSILFHIIATNLSRSGRSNSLYFPNTRNNFTKILFMLSLEVHKTILCSLFVLSMPTCGGRTLWNKHTTRTTCHYIYFAIICIQGTTNRSHLNGDRSIEITHYILPNTSPYYNMPCRRQGFNCESIINENCDFSPRAQLLERNYCYAMIDCATLQLPGIKRV